MGLTRSHLHSEARYQCILYNSAELYQISDSVLASGFEYFSLSLYKRSKDIATIGHTHSGLNTTLLLSMAIIVSYYLLIRQRVVLQSNIMCSVFAFTKLNGFIYFHPFLSFFVYVRALLIW